MKKAITPVVSVILLIMLTIVASVGAYFFITSSVNDLQSSGAIEDSPYTDNSRLNLVSITGSQALVRNDGTSPVTEIVVLINGEALNYTLDTPIQPGEIREINYTTQLAGQDLEIKLIYNKGKTEKDTRPASQNTALSGFNDSSITTYCGDGICQSSENITSCSNDCTLYFAWPQRGAHSNWDNVANDGTNVSTSTPEIIWVYNITNNTLGISGSDAASIFFDKINPVIGDIDNDKYQEIVYLTSSNSIIGKNLGAVDNNGANLFSKLISSANTIDPYESAPIVSDLDKDGYAEIYYHNFTHIISMHANNQQERWIAGSNTEVGFSPYIQDLSIYYVNVTNDEFYEIVTRLYNSLSSNYGIQILDKDGEGVWNYDGYATMTGAAADTDGDGLDELFGAYTSNYMRGLDNNGNVLWTGNEMPNSQYVGVTNQNVNRLFFVGDNNLYVQDAGAAGNFEYSLNIMSGWTFMALADLNSDDYKDFVINYGNQVFAYDYANNAQELWNVFTAFNDMTPSPVLGDINGDNTLDLITFKDNVLYAFRGNNGQELWNLQINTLTYGNSNYIRIALADINLDGKLDIILGIPYNSRADPNSVGEMLMGQIIVVTTQ